MWGNLAGRLGANDLNATLQKVAQAVAPPPGEEYDDDESYDDNESYDDDEDGDYEDDGEEDEEENATGGGFGFVGMLARVGALDRGNEDEDKDKDQDKQDHENGSDYEDIKEAGGEGILENGTSLPSPDNELKMAQFANESNAAEAKASSIEDSVQISADSNREQAQLDSGEGRGSPLQERGIDKNASREETSDVSKQPTTTAEKTLHNNDAAYEPNRFTSTPEDNKETTDLKQSENMPTFGNIASALNEKETTETLPEETGVKTMLEKPKKIVELDQTTPAEISAGEIIGDGDRVNFSARNEAFEMEPQKSPPQAQKVNSEVISLDNFEKDSPRETSATDHSDSKESFLKPESDEMEGKIWENVVAQNGEGSPGCRPGDTSSEKQFHSEHYGNDKEISVLSPGVSSGTEVLAHEWEQKLRKAEEMIAMLNQQAEEEKLKSKEMTQKMMLDFQMKEARLLEASSEEHNHELKQLENSYQAELRALQEKMAKERRENIEKQEQYRKALEEKELRGDKVEKELERLHKKHESALAQAEQREKRSVHIAEEKVARTMALLDERDEQIAGLKKLVKKLESTMNEHAEGAEEAEQEVEELETENETLREQVDRLEAEREKLRSEVATLGSDAEKLSHLQLELTMLREERARERQQSQSAVESAITSHSQVETERDAAFAEIKDLKQQLAAALADLEIATADKERITMANTNLQAALEAFQDERQAEMDILSERHQEALDGLISAHGAALDAARQTHKAEMGQFQMAADLATKHAMNQCTELESELKKLRSENNQLRRSLDEAIHRLQTTQEDVIDRTLMKNILLDWCTMKEKEKRHQVLQLMASVLHFTEEEREKVHLTHLDIESVRNRVVGAFAAPIPPSKADVEHLQGENVREKWVNFLLAETDDAL